MRNEQAQLSPRRPWPYAMTFVLSQDNEIVIGDSECRKMGDELVRFVIAAVNAYTPPEAR